MVINVQAELILLCAEKEQGRGGEGEKGREEGEEIFWDVVGDCSGRHWTKKWEWM